MYKIYHCICLVLILTSCSHELASIKNERKGTMSATYQLAAMKEKQFYLDSVTAPRPIYMQLLRNKTGARILSFLNVYNSSIYFYDYSNAEYIKRIQYNKEGANSILRPQGYYVKNMDSIYVYDMMKIEIVLTDSLGNCKHRIPLKNSVDDKWALYYPQYSLSTVVPFLENQGKLILTGYSPFSLPQKNIRDFLFTTYIDLKTNQVLYHHKYPEELYGHDFNWEGGFATIVYPCISAENKLIHSFPVSHNLYLSKFEDEKSIKIYGGSNIAKTIHSIDHEQRRTSNELIAENYLQQDLYGAIIHDPYRKMYYRFFLQGIPNATINTSKDEKPIIVIMMNEQFEYLGETVIGTGKEWNWTNSFVTSEGLNIEYIDNNDIDEYYLNLKIFIPKRI